MNSSWVCRAHLDLGHGGSTFPNTGSAHVDARSAAAEEAEEGGGSEQGEREEEEGSSCLTLATTPACVGSTIGDVVASGVVLAMLASACAAAGGVHTLLLHECTPRPAARAAAPAKMKRALSASSARGMIG